MNRLTSLRYLGPILFCVLLAGPAVAYEVGDWTVIQLTDNDTNDTFPRVSGDTVVWSGMGDTSHWQIFMWRDGETTQLTDDGLGHVQPRIGEGLVVWTAGLSRVFSYDGTLHELTPSYESHGSPEASRNQAAWLGEGNGVNKDVYYFDGSEYTRITDTPNQEYDVRISGPSVTWWDPGANGTGDIYYYDGVEVIPVTENDFNEKYPQITDGGPGDLHLTYEAYLDGQWDIMHFDGTTTVNLSSTPGVSETIHQSCDNRTVWRTYEDGQYKIWLHDGISATVVSPPDMYATDPQVSESLVTWVGAGDIFVYDGTDVTQLTDNGITNDNEPQVDGNVIVWHTSGLEDSEVFMAYRTPTHVGSVPDASALTVHGAQPNPFNPSTEIVFSIGSSEQVGVKIFDLRGHLVKDLGTQMFETGQHSVAWNGRNDQGQAVSSGVYFYQVETPTSSQMGKLTLVE